MKFYKLQIDLIIEVKVYQTILTFDAQEMHSYIIGNFRYVKENRN